MRKLLTNLIVFILIFSVMASASACGGNEEPNSVQSKFTFSGTHIYNAVDTDTDFLKDGRTDYVIVLPEKKSSVLLNAYQEFLYFFKMATDINLATLTDVNLSDTQHKSGTKYISLGNTTLLKSSGIVLDKNLLGEDGFKIATVDTNVYICATTDYGTRFGVYQFMRMYFNFEAYTVNTIEIDKNVKNLKLKNFDVTDVPDFDYRKSCFSSTDTFYGTDYDQVNFARRIGQNDKMYDEYMKVCNADTLQPVALRETTMDILTREGNPSKWFSDNGNQWCYTAHGDEESLNAMIEKVSNAVYETMKIYNPTDYPRAHVFSMDIEDNSKGCTCEACAAMARRYGGANSAAMIKFLNRIAANVREWMAKPENQAYARDNFKIMFLAYLHMTQPPTYYDETTKSYKPYDDSVILDDMLITDMANIDADYQQSVYAEDNKWVRDVYEGWRALGKNFHWYFYSQNLRNRVVLYDVFSSLNTEGMQYYAYLSKDGESHFYHEDQGGIPTGAATVFDNLQCYLSAKLMWNTSLDSAILTENYFRAVYGNAASIMKKFFDDVRMFYYNENERLGYFCRTSVGNYVHLNFNWSEQILYKWLNYCDRAHEVISQMETSDPQNYVRISENIEMEALMPMYMLITQCSDRLTGNQYDAIKARVSDDLVTYPELGKICTARVNFQNQYFRDWVKVI